MSKRVEWLKLALQQISDHYEQLRRPNAPKHFVVTHIEKALKKRVR